MLDIILMLLFELIEKPNLPDNYKESTWEKLKEAVEAIHASKSISSSLEELYKAVENLCSHNMSQALYEKLREVCESHVRSNINQFVKYPFIIFNLLMITVVST